MTTMEPAMSSELQDTAARYADDCARTLLANYRAETDPNHHDQWTLNCARTWAAHEDALRRFEQTFPRLEWRDHADRGLLRAIEGALP